MGGGKDSDALHLSLSRDWLAGILKDGIPVDPLTEGIKCSLKVITMDEPMTVDERLTKRVWSLQGG